MYRNVVLLIVSGFALLPLLQAGDSGDRVHYMGGTVAELPSKTEGTIHTTDADLLVFSSGKVTVKVPYESVTNIEYGQRISHRYVEAILISPLFLMTKKRAHFLTLGYTDEAGHHQAMVFQMKPGDVRSVLVSLEARTGRKVEYQDEEARKAGKG